MTRLEAHWLPGSRLYVCTRIQTPPHICTDDTHTHTQTSAQAQKGTCKMTHMHACTLTHLRGDQQWRPVNRINSSCMMGNFIVPARVSLMLLAVLFWGVFLLLPCFYFQSYVTTAHLCYLLFPKGL